MAPIPARVRAQPVLGWPMAAFARYAFRGFHPVGQSNRGNGLEGRVANGAGRGLGRIAQLQEPCNPLGAGSFQRRIRASVVIIVLGPNGELMLVVARSAVATGRTATGGTEEFGEPTACILAVCADSN